MFSKRPTLSPEPTTKAAPRTCVKAIIGQIGIKKLIRPLFSSRQRTLAVIMAVVIVATISGIAITRALTAQRYKITVAQAALLPRVNPNLNQKISYDSATKTYQFNKQPAAVTAATYAAANPANQLQAGLGGKKANDNFLYSVNLPADSRQGITYTDNSLHLSFKVTPVYKTWPGKNEQGRLVYPMNGGGTAVYTPMANGLKEDILYNTANQAHSVQYRLTLPATLQARMVPGTGEIGIYSADRALFGNITFSDAADKAGVMKARLVSPKTHLAFIIPPPVITQSGKTHPQVDAHFQLRGNIITVVMPQLSALGYPISIDPSVVITSSAAFATGNTDDNISYPSNEITRGQLSGGTISTGWTNDTANPLLVGVNAEVSVAYDGYIYEMGGYNGTASQTGVYYAPINSNGSIGAWVSSPNVLQQPTDAAFSVVYNGYVYVMGGYPYPTTTYYNNVYYAKLSPTGGVGAWQSASVLPQGLQGAGAVVYNGYIYVMGGSNGASVNTVYHVQINANGSLGTWSTDTNVLPQNLDVAASAVYNGYLYVMGGYTGSADSSAVYYAPINSDHSVGAWVTDSNPLPVAEDAASAAVVGGYMYVMGGYTGSYVTTVYYSQINADGSLGVWLTTTALPQALSYNPAVVNNGYIYLLGGANSSVAGLNTVYYGKVDPAGVLTPWATTSGFIKQGTGKGVTGREDSAMVAANGYLYNLGGDDGTSVAYTEYASINVTTGVLGSWAGTTNLPKSLNSGQAIAYNGYVYFFNGCSGYLTATTCVTPTAAAYVSAIGTGGVLGGWTTLTAPPTALFGGMAAEYNGYVYLLGGINGSGTFLNSVWYAQLATGGLAANSGCGTTWCTTGSFNTGRAYGGAVAYDGYLYVADGVHATSDTACNTVASTYCDDVQYAQITSTGALSTNTCGTSVTWCTTSNMNLSGSTEGGIFATRGYLYTPLGAYAVINANGTVGTWQTTTTFATSRIEYGSAYYYGNLYIAGGNSAGTYDSDAQYATINNGGGGSTGLYTTLTSNLPGTIQGAASVAENGFLYEIGGDLSGAITASVFFAQFSPTGTLITNLTSCPSGGTLYNGTWCSTTSLSAPLWSSVSVGANGYIYVLGGQQGSGAITNATYAAQISSNGSLGSWTAGPNLPGPMDQSTGAIGNGYVYIVGGNNGNPSGSVYFAQLMSNGSFATLTSCPSGGTLYNSAWCSTTSLPQPVQTSAAVVAGSYIYLVGGYNTTYLNTVYYANINSNGALGSWNTTISLPVTSSSNTAVAYDGYLYELGGGGAGGSSVYRSAIGANGNLSPWIATTYLPVADYGSTSAVQNGYMYEIGGNTGSAILSNVYYAPLYSMPRVGHYSNLINLGISYDGSTVTSITYNGSLSNGLSAISYETAGTNAIFTSPSTAGYLAANPPTLAPACTTSPITEYVWVYITMNDGSTAIFPDSLSADSYVTNLTVNYNTNVGHPPPNLRLRGGQWFNDQILQPLDTCRP